MGQLPAVRRRAASGQTAVQAKQFTAVFAPPAVGPQQAGGRIGALSEWEEQAPLDSTLRRLVGAGDDVRAAVESHLVESRREHRAQLGALKAEADAVVLVAVAVVDVVIVILAVVVTVAGPCHLRPGQCSSFPSVSLAFPSVCAPRVCCAVWPRT